MVGALALTLGTTGTGGLGWQGAIAQEKVSPEVGKHLKDVQAMLRAGKYREALAKLRDAEAVPGRNAGENALIERMRLAGAQGVGDADTMVRAFEALKSSGRLGGDNLPYLEAISGTYQRANQNGKALQWANRYFAEGGNSAAMRNMQKVAQFNSGDVGPVLKSTMAEIQAAEKAGQVPSRDKIDTLLFAANKLKDSAAEAYGLERLLTHYPSKEIWASALATVQARKGFADRYMVDLLRLRLVTGNLRGADDYMELAQLAAANGSPDEGVKVVEAGFAAGVLGTGTEAARHQRLKEFMAKKVADSKAAFATAEAEARSAKDGNALIPLGLQLAQRGEGRKGAAMIDEGIAKGGLKREEDAKLALGLAWFLAGDTPKAIAAWRGVKGTEGAADVARLWSVHARQAKR
jgi:hypothetical protein